MQYPNNQENSICAGPFFSTAITQDGKLVYWGKQVCSHGDLPPTLEHEYVVAVSCGWYHLASQQQ
jgi:hypothetical protein